MREMIEPKINDIDLIPYQTHARILELKVAFLHSTLVTYFGEVAAQSFLKNWCEINTINFTIISGIITQKPRIMKLALTNKMLFRQQVVFMGHLFNESRSVVGKRYLNMSKSAMYRRPDETDVHKFLTNEFLFELVESITVCGVPVYKLEAERLLSTLEEFLEVMGNVSVAKNWL